MKKIGEDDDYNLLSKDIVPKPAMKQVQFDKEYWVSLPKDIQFERMMKLTNKLLKTDDKWAEEKLKVRRESRAEYGMILKMRRDENNKWKLVLKQNG